MIAGRSVCTAQVDPDLADSPYDRGFQFLAIDTAEVELVAGEADRDGVARFPFARGVAAGGGAFVFPGVNHAFNVDHDGAADRTASRFAQDLGLGLIPVFRIVTFDRPAALVEFGSPAADDLVRLSIVPRHSRHSRTACKF